MKFSLIRIDYLQNYTHGGNASAGIGHMKKSYRFIEWYESFLYVLIIDREREGTLTTLGILVNFDWSFH